MPRVQCFFVEDAGEAIIRLRRYSSGSTCKGKYGFHNASSGQVGRRPRTKGKHVLEEDLPTEAFPAGDVRWPRFCECGYQFQDTDEWQVNQDQVYRDAATGKEYSLHEPVPGMMWDAWWYADTWKGPDGRCLCVVTPDGHTWIIDSRASNCDMKDDNVHKCWIRHGEPPNITVDKDGLTCHAGAGSIQTPKWHGFLTRGILAEERDPR